VDWGNYHHPTAYKHCMIWTWSPLCIEFGIILAEHRTLITGGLEKLPPPDSIQALHDLDLESRVGASLAFEEWYSRCGHCLAHSRVADTSMPGEITLGAIIYCPTLRDIKASGSGHKRDGTGQILDGIGSDLEDGSGDLVCACSPEIRLVQMFRCVLRFITWQFLTRFNPGK
jgi:hypothetical protein